MKICTKTMLIEEVASKVGCSKAQSANFINSFFEVIVSELKHGNKVAVPGFISFEVSERKERQGFNPLTKKPIKIAAKKVAKVKLGKQLKECVVSSGKKGK